MTTPHSSELPALHTDADVHERVSMLVGTAVTDRQLWIMFLDGDGVQAPVLMPIAEMPAAPDPGIVDRLAEVLGSGLAHIILTVGSRAGDAGCRAPSR